MRHPVFENGIFAACPAHFNMARHTLGHGKTPEKVALEVIKTPGLIDESWTYGALAAAVLKTAAGFVRMGIKPGDRVVLRIGNRSEFPILFFALNALGAVPVPLSFMLTDSETLTILDELDAALICADIPVGSAPCRQISGDEMRDLAAADPIEFADTLAEQPAYIIFTSGTGGRPKGVVHAQRAAWARRMMWDGWYGLKSSDRMLHAGGFNWSYTLGAGLTDPWANGATALIFTGDKKPGVWAEIFSAHKPSIFAATPGIYRQILGAKGDEGQKFSSLRHCLSAGEALPDSILQRWQSRTGTAIYEALGMSEISTFISHSPSIAPRKNTAGKAQPGRHIAILDVNNHPLGPDEEGLLAVHKSDQGLMLNYLNRPAPAGEWFLTGDRAKIDKDGYVRHLGRNDALLNAGGYRVSPREIANTILALKGIDECVALEILVKQDTRVIAVFYTGVQHSVDALKNHCAKTLAAYKCPRIFVYLDKLPRSENGKILKKSLREKYDWKHHDNP